MSLNKFHYVITIFLTLFSFFPKEIQAIEDIPANNKGLSKIKNVLYKVGEEFKSKVLPITVASLTDRVIFHPPETVITLQQSFLKESYKTVNFLEATKYLYKTEGVQGFYKGFFWPTATAVPTRLAVFGSFYATKSILEEIASEQRFIYSGIVAGLVKSLIQCPSEAERVRLTCGIEIKNKLSPRNLFKGFIPLSLKHFFSVTPALAGTDIVLHNYGNLKQNPIFPFVLPLSISFMFQVIATPMDMLKTRVMEDYTSKSLTSHFSQLIKDRKMIYRTFWPIAIRSSAGSGIMIGMLHFIERVLNKSAE